MYPLKDVFESEQIINAMNTSKLGSCCGPVSAIKTEVVNLEQLLMANPVKLQNKSIPWIASLFLLILLLLLSIVTVGASSGINEECNIYQAILIIEPIWIFIYYRLYSRLLIKLMDILTCECAEHGVGYAIFHYCIWGMNYIKIYKFYYIFDYYY